MKIFSNRKSYIGRKIKEPINQVKYNKKISNQLGKRDVEKDNDNVARAMKADSYHRGDILLVDFGSNLDYCLTVGIRPAICISCSGFNEYAPIMTVVPMTKHFKHLNMDSHVFIDKEDCIGLWESGMAMCEQLRCIDRSQAVRKIASINNKELLHRINQAIQKHFGVEEGQS